MILLRGQRSIDGAWNMARIEVCYSRRNCFNDSAIRSLFIKRGRLKRYRSYGRTGVWHRSAVDRVAWYQRRRSESPPTIRSARLIGKPYFKHKSAICR
jgi:hypothetical protein